MIYDASGIAIGVFLAFVLFVICLSFYLGRKTKSAEGYFAAGGNIHWSVNGIAFAGDYLSAASFLGICGMIAFSGYDGFLYSIGYLAGWVVALFVIAEPMRRLGKYTFASALDYKFNSKGIQLMAAISTLVVSMCYLIPQMVGAGSLVTPLLGLDHMWGVIMVGAIVIFIVATAGMASTTYVQFMKGGLLIIFSTVLVFLVLRNGFDTTPSKDFHHYRVIEASVLDNHVSSVADRSYSIQDQVTVKGETMVRLARNDESSGNLNKESPSLRLRNTWWHLVRNDDKDVLEEALSFTVNSETKEELYNGAPKAEKMFYQVGNISKLVYKGNEVNKTGPLTPFSFLNTIENSDITTYKKLSFKEGSDAVIVWYPATVSGKEVLRPGLKFKVQGGLMDKVNFISLMLALFFGTSALPHILIRYYTVPTQASARKSTIVAISAIGFFYILTMFMGLGAMVNGVLDVQSSNMSAPLLAKYFGLGIFAIISAIAFATVLGTVSGLIVAAAGAVAHDLIDNFLNIDLSDRGKVMAGKMAAFSCGLIAIILGIVFKGMNVSFLVGWAFAVAASANLPAIMMLLFWKKTTSRGIAVSILVGMVSSLGIILLSPSMCERYFKWWQIEATSPIGLNNPGIISIPLSFITLVVVSLLTQKPKKTVG